MNIEKHKYKVFGRFKGRKKKLLTTPDDYKKFYLNFNSDLNPSNYNILDIGSGSGENSIFQSEKKPFSKVIACDLFVDGNINLFNSILTKNIKNINLFEGNVIELIDKINFPNFFDEIWILFPDPWPKLRHQKRRLINTNFLNKIYLLLKNNAKIFISSDSASYIQSIIFCIYDSRKYYDWKNQRPEDWNYGNLDLPETKFFKKAKKMNKNAILFELIKI